MRDREKASVGVMLTMHPPMKPMREEAASAGFFKSASNKTHPRVQLRTVADLLAGKGVDLPACGVVHTFKLAARVKAKTGTPPLPIPDDVGQGGHFETGGPLG